MNIQGRFPLGLTGLIFLQSIVFSRVFSSITVQRKYLGSTFFSGIDPGTGPAEMKIETWQFSGENDTIQIAETMTITIVELHTRWYEGIKENV